MNTEMERIKSTHEIINRLKRVPRDKRDEVLNIVYERAKAQSYQSSSSIKEEPFAFLSVEEIKRLSLEPLVTIGSHSMSHEILPNLSLEEAGEEIFESKRILEDWVQKPVNHFAYPDGKYTPTIARLVENAGYKTATRIGLELFRKNRLFEIPRLGNGSWDSDYAFRAMVNGYFSLKVEILRWLRNCGFMK